MTQDKDNIIDLMKTKREELIKSLRDAGHYVMECEGFIVSYPIDKFNNLVEMRGPNDRLH